MRVAKADLVPTDANLLGGYADWASLEVACEAFCEDVNGRVKPLTDQPPPRTTPRKGRPID